MGFYAFRIHAMPSACIFKIFQKTSGQLLLPFCSQCTIFTVAYYGATQRTFWPQPSKLFPNTFLIFSPKKPALKEFLIFSQKSLYFRKGLEPWHNGTFLYFRTGIFRTLALWSYLIFPEMELSYTSGNGTFLYFRKQNFLIFQERYVQNLLHIQNQNHIQNPGIFRTLVYSEP